MLFKHLQTTRQLQGHDTFMLQAPNAQQRQAQGQALQPESGKGNILISVDHNTKSTGFKPRPLICRSVSILQDRFSQHQPLVRDTDPQQNQNALSILLLAKVIHKSPILNSQIFICALFLIAQRQENQV